MYVDTHCHFDFPPLSDQPGQCLKRCEKLGLEKIIIPGVEVRQWPLLAELCETSPILHFAAGIHPWYLGNTLALSGLQAQQKLQAIEPELLSCLSTKACVAVGECGLHKSQKGVREMPSLAAQILVLEWHLQQALNHHLPVILHCVKAHNEMLQVLGNYSGLRGVVHAFSGSVELGERYIHKGFSLGVGGGITYPRARKTRTAVSVLPLSALVLETDAPDMPLCGRQGEANSPEALPDIAACLAQLRGDTVNNIADVTRDNAYSLFDLRR